MENTSTSVVYEAFFGLITDDMYVTLTEEETLEDVYGLLLLALPRFEFPKEKIALADKEYFSRILSAEEILILANLMTIFWIERQMAHHDMTKMLYSGNEMRVASQANHLDKLMKLKANYENDNKHLQRLYDRKKFAKEGETLTSWGIMTSKGVDR